MLTRVELLCIAGMFAFAGFVFGWVSGFSASLPVLQRPRIWRIDDSEQTKADQGKC